MNVKWGLINYHLVAACIFPPIPTPSLMLPDPGIRPLLPQHYITAVAVPDLIPPKFLSRVRAVEAP